MILPLIRRAVGRLLPLSALPLALITASATPPAVLTYHNDGSRTGANLQETVLNTGNVSPGTFGKIFTRPVDDQLYSQLLYVPGVNIPNRGTHNVLYAATVNDTVYAFDADYPALDLPLWKTSFLSSGVVPVTAQNMSTQGACGGSYRDFSGNIGIVGTPVIDPSPWPGAPPGDQGTLYVVARTVELGKFAQRLHALNLQTGQERPGSPVLIQYSGRLGNSNLTFNSTIQNQRPGLALVNGRVYIGWASHCDLGQYHGWLMGYDSHTLQQASVYCTTPSGVRGGIWMGGSPPSFDEQGNLYLSTGNGTISTADRGESFLKLTPSGTTMDVASFFTPYNYSQLEGGDIDLGSAGLLLFPGANGQNLAIGAGKQGRLYVVDRDNMGGVQSGSDSQIIQSIDVGLNGKIMGGPIYWQGPSGVKKFYIWGAYTTLKAYTYNGSTFNTTPQTSTMVASNPGAMLSLSANGSTAGTGIVWAMCPNNDANQQVVTGVLRAFNAENLSQELWNSTLNPSRDDIGSYAKFNQPTIANGYVYVPTFSNQILIYGQLPATPAPPAPDSLAATAPTKVQVHLEWTMAAGTTQSGFIVERSTDGVNFDQIIYLPADARSHEDTTVARFSHYVYRIKAFNLAGSAISQTAEVSTTTGGPEAEIGIIGSGHAIPADSAFPTVVNGTAFGQILLGTGGSSTHAFTIRNDGNAPLNLTGSPAVAIAGAGAGDFTVIQPAVTVIPPQGTADVSITFTPSAAGARSAMVTVANDDPYGSPFRFAITGLGTQQDLVAQWRFNEAVGALSTEDATGRGHTGTATINTPAFGRAGFFDESVAYPSTFGATIQPLITVADAPDLNPVDGITLACWIRWNGPSSGYSQPIVYKGVLGEQYRLYIDEFGLKADLGQIANLATAVPSRQVWHHVAVTYDGAAARLYLDGVEKSSVSSSAALLVSSSPFLIGGQASSAFHFSGSIDDLRVYGRGLTAAEVQKLVSQKTAISLVAPIAETRKGDSSTGQFEFQSQQPGNLVNVNFEIVSGPGQGIYRTDYGMSIIPPVATLPANSSVLDVDVTPLAFNTVTGPLDVTLRVLDGDGYQVGKRNTATVHILDTRFNEWRIDQFGSIERANQPDAAENADPAGDGVNNLFKYALGLPALTPAQPQVTVTQEEWYDGDHMVMRCEGFSPPREDMEYVAEWQVEDISGEWQQTICYPLDHGDGTTTYEAACPIPLGDHPHVFMRLRMTRR